MYFLRLKVKEFLIRTIACIMFGFYLAYSFSVKIPNFLDVLQNEKLVIANFLFMIIFSAWFLFAYMIRLKFLFIATSILTVLAVSL